MSDHFLLPCHHLPLDRRQPLDQQNFDVLEILFLPILFTMMTAQLCKDTKIASVLLQNYTTYRYTVI